MTHKYKDSLFFECQCFTQHDEIRENDALTERSCEYWPGASEYTGGRKRKMKEEPDFYAPFEPEVIVNYPQDGMDDEDDQVGKTFTLQMLLAMT
jgi:hypothetical protein